MDKKKEETKPAAAKVYDGSRVVSHVVKSGETLSKIAAIYRFHSYEPIWIYNSKVQALLSDSPDTLKEGHTIFIPRGRQGYAEAIKKLKLARIQAEAMADELLYGVEADENRLAASKEMLDFASDVATSLASLGLKAAEAAKTAAAIKTAGAQAKMAQSMSANALSKEYAEKFAEVAAKRNAIAKEGLVKNAKYAEDLKKKLGQKTIGYGAGKADEFVKQKTGSPEAAQFKNTYKAMTTIEKIGKAWSQASIGAKSLEFTGILLDYLKPSTLAETFLLITTGETAADAQKNAKAGIKKSLTATQARIDGSIKAFTAESKLLYG